MHGEPDSRACSRELGGCRCSAQALGHDSVSGPTDDAEQLLSARPVRVA